ncbi:MAG: carbohydrate kinase [Burkholderiales bacterium]|nr:carbohydrate kinase [Burkholderiales bacterium]
MFVVAGEALMDVFTGATTPTGIALDARIGGSPLNVAFGFARMGRPVAFLGGISQGELGGRLLDALRAEGVALDAVHRSSAPTTISLVGVDAKGVPEYAFYGTGAADRTLPLAALDRMPADARLLHVGSYTMVVGETAQTQRALVERVHGRMVVSYDPNLRLNVEPSLQAWRDTLAWMLPRTDVLKLSDEDLGLLYPGIDPAAFAADCLGKGAGLVALTRGGKGAFAWHASGVVEVPPVHVDVIDTVGAGDTFQSALITRLDELGVLTPERVRGMDAETLLDAMRFAAQAAAITCSRRGADLPRRAEMGIR